MHSMKLFSLSSLDYTWDESARVAIALDAKKCRLGPQKGFRSLGLEKIAKNSKMCYN
jgi:hypothetical protein